MYAEFDVACASLLQVDSSTFIKDFASRQPLAARPDLGDGGNLRPVVDLLVCAPPRATLCVPTQAQHRGSTSILGY
jgi:hypothetical protein